MDGDGDDELLLAATNAYTGTLYYEGTCYLIEGGPDTLYGLQEDVSAVAASSFRGGTSYTYYSIR
jgi:hypothetical protein